MTTIRKIVIVVLIVRMSALWIFKHSKQIKIKCMNTKSPMQELINELQSRISNRALGNDVQWGKELGYEFAIDLATSLLAKESELQQKEVGGEDGYYRWVKASERTPVKDLSPLVIRMNRGFLTTAVFNGKYFELQTGFDNTKYDSNYFGLIEWLEFIVKPDNPCMEKGCAEAATKDYNGHGHFVCDYHYNKLNDEFDEEYK